MPLSHHSTRANASEKYVYSAYMLCSRLVFSEYLHQVLQAGRSVLGLCGWVTDSCLCCPLFMCLLPHTVITLCSPLWLLCCCLPWTRCTSNYSMSNLLVYHHHVMCYCCLNTIISVQPLSMLGWFCFCPVSQRSILITDQICKFRIPRLRCSLAYLHQSAASPTSSVAIGGNGVCVLSSLLCIVQGRLLIASLTAGLNIIPITENFSVMSHESSRGNAPVTIVTSVPWERERDITEVAVLAARPAKRHSVLDSDVTVTYTAFILPLSLSVFACDLHTLRQLASHLDWREPIGLQKGWKGRSSHNEECPVMSRSRSQGTEVTIVTRAFSNVL